MDLQVLHDRARHRGVLGALAAAVLIAAAGCGGSNDNNTSTTSGSSGGSASTTAAPAVKKPTGTPYKLAVLDDDPTQPENEIFDTVKATIDEVNAAGGVNGRPLSAEHCSGQVNQNASAACARKVVADTSVISTVGNFLANGAGSAGILDKGQVASLGNFATAPDEYSCHACFPMGMTSLGGSGAVMALPDAAKIQKLGVLFIDVPAARQYQQLIAGTLKSSGRDAQMTKVIYVPPGTTNYAGVIAQFDAAGVQGIALELPRAMTEAFLRTAGQQGYSKPVGLSLGGTDLTTLSKLPPAATKNLVLSSIFNRSGSTYDAILKLQQQKGILLGSDESLNAYLAVQLFKTTVSGKTDIDRAGLVAAANALPPFDNGGMSKDIDFSKTSPYLGGTFKRINPYLWYYKYAGGTNLQPYVSGNPAFNFFEAPTS